MLMPCKNNEAKPNCPDNYVCNVTDNNCIGKFLIFLHDYILQNKKNCYEGKFSYFSFRYL